MAYVPGAAFFADDAAARTRCACSFVTVPPEQIDVGVAALARRA